MPNIDGKKHPGDTNRKPLLVSNDSILAMLLVVCIAGNSVFVPYFFSVSNLLDATRAGGEIGLMGIGMTVVLLVGGIDLSVGSIFALSAMVMGLSIAAGAGLWLGIVLCLVTGVVAGMFNGLVITRIGIPPIVTTLATMAVYRGVTVAISGGNSYPIPSAIEFLGQGAILGIPTQLLLLIVLSAAISFVLRRTDYGLHLFAIGNNETAAAFSALRVKRLKVSVYMLSGFLSAVASLVYVSRVVSAKADFGIGYELSAITIAVLGGASLSGGRAKVLGTFISVLIIVFLTRGLTMGFVGTNVQSMIVGAILIGAVGSRSLGGRTGVE